MKSVGLLAIVIAVTFGYAQAPDTLWTKTYGGAGNDGAKSILQTSDGGYIVAGHTDWDLWILRLDSLGVVLWTKTYGGPHYAASIQHTTDGGYVIVGGRYPDEIWLLKTDENGDTLWTNSFGPFSRGGWGNDVIQTSDGGYVIAGIVTRLYVGGGLIIRTDSFGDTLWTNDCVGRMCMAVQETPDSNYIVGGIHGWGASGAGSAFGLTKVDTLGTVLWSQMYFEYNGPDAFGRCNDVLVTNDGCLAACGVYGDGDYDICLIRTNASGDTLWTKFFCEGAVYAEYPWERTSSFDRTSDGGYIMVGATSSEDAIFIRTDALGETLWTAVYGGPEYDNPREVLQSSDGGYIMAGETRSFGAGNNDVWIVKLGPDVGVEENKNIVLDNDNRTTTIFRGHLQLPEGKQCKVYDITGRIVEPDKIQPGIYFIEIDGIVTQKVVKVR